MPHIDWLLYRRRLQPPLLSRNGYLIYLSFQNLDFMSIIPSLPKSNLPPPSGGKSTAPPIRMKMRADLACNRVAYQGVEYWVVKDPLAQKYFQFPPPVFFLLQLLDGQCSIEDLENRYHQQYSPKRITRNDLQQLLTRFHKDNLVISEMPSQGIELLKRGNKSNRMEMLGKFSNILAIRYRGFDPERILNFLIRFTWWLFTPTMVVLTLIAAAVALFSVVINWGEFQSRLPGFDQFFDVRQWYLFIGVLAVTKILHEFGHGLACKRLGGECHEIGIMLLVLTPCLYCNVSDSWRLPNKWHRAAIGAAGMYIEIMLATLATIVWWFVQPGLVQDICLRVMLISSISTILFNGNPLLRFDGYYILSDLLEIPNLHQKANRALTTLLGRHWLGLEIPDDQLMPANRPWAFAMFTVAAFLYRWFVLIVIVGFLIRFLEPYGLESIGVGIAMFSMITIIGMPMFKLYKFMSVPGRFFQVKRGRFSIILIVAMAILGLIFFVPFPHYLRCQTIVMPRELETIWVRQPGFIEEILVQPGQSVTAGQIVARLRNIDLELQLSEIESQIKEHEINRERIIQQATTVNLSSLDQLPRIQSDLQKDRQLAFRLRQQQSELEITSPIEGVVMLTPFEYQSRNPQELEDVDSTSLFLGKHSTAVPQTGQRLCEIADTTNWQAVVLLSENQYRFASPGQETRIRLYSNPSETIQSQVDSIVETDRSIDRDQYEPASNAEKSNRQVAVRPPDLIVEMVAQLDQSQLQYMARVKLPDDVSGLRIGQGGQARIFAGYRSLSARLWWWINENFRL